MLKHWETFAKKFVTQICVRHKLRTRLQVARSGLIIKSFWVPRCPGTRGTDDRGFRTHQCLVAIHPLATFVSMAKAVLFTLSFTILH